MTDLIPSAVVSASSNASSLNGLNRHSDGPLREQARTDSVVTVRGDEHNRNRLPPACQFLLQVGSRHADHRDVENAGSWSG